MINQLKIAQEYNGCLKSKSTAHSTHTHNHVQQDFAASKHFGMAEVKDDDSKFKFYTGLTFYQFIVLLKFLGSAASKLTCWNSDVKYPETSPNKKRGCRRKLSPQDEFFVYSRQVTTGTSAFRPGAQVHWYRLHYSTDLGSIPVHPVW